MTDARWAVREVTAAELSPADLRAWSELEARAAEPNAYLSRHFVLPALRHLDPNAKAAIVIVERGGALGGLGVFVPTPPTRVCPVPHLAGYLSRHSFLGGMLIEKGAERDVVRAMFAAARRKVFWQAIVFPWLQADGAVAKAFEEGARELGLAASPSGTRERAVLVPSAGGPDAVREALGKRLKEIERCKRRIEETGGAVTWRCLREHVDDAAVETFLRLEHGGWKSDEHSSLRSDPADESFFKDVVRGFDGESRALFTELRMGDRPIASTSNFVSGGAGFAFKIGWDVELKKYGPGMINEVELVRAAPEVCADLAWFDSGAAPDSFINKLWPERRTLVSLVVPLTTVAGIGLRLYARVRPLAKRLRDRVQA